MGAVNRTAQLAAAAALLALLACATARVSSDYDPSADFASLRSYAWLAAAQPKTGDPRIDNPLLDARIRAAIDAELAARGVRRAEPDAADFLVAYHVAVERKVDVDTIYRSYGRAGWGGSGWTETVVREYDEGTLLVDFLRPGEGALLWRGTAKTRLREARTPEQRDAYVKQVVAELLAAYPPE